MGKERLRKRRKGLCWSLFSSGVDVVFVPEFEDGVRDADVT